MPIIYKVVPAGDHSCEPPKEPEKQYGRGTVWACDVCGKQYRLEHDQREGWIWVMMLKEDYIKH